MNYIYVYFVGMDCNIITVYFNGKWKIVGGVWQFDGRLCKPIVFNVNIGFEELRSTICDTFEVNTMVHDIKLTYSNPIRRLKPYNLCSTADLGTFFLINKMSNILWSLPLCVSLVTKVTESSTKKCYEGMPLPTDTACLDDTKHASDSLDEDETNVPNLPENPADRDKGMKLVDADPRTTKRFIKKGQSFRSKEDLKIALSLLAIAENFEFRVKKSNKLLIVVNCIEKECKWRVRASKLKNSSIFFISKYIDKHNCAFEKRRAHQRQASYKVIANRIKAM